MVSKNDFTLSIVIPAYNEAENIEDAVAMITSALPASVNDYEIIIIDDGSKDSTGNIIRELASHNERIRVFCNEKNRGKGAALTSGFRYSRMEWLLFTDADLQINISELASFLPYTAEFDVIAGFRQRRKDPLSRRIFSKIYACIILLLLGIRIRDINCPFKLIRSSILKSLELHASGFFIDTEFMHIARQRNYRIKELPVACQPRQKGTSTVRFRHVLETVKELLATIRRNPSAKII